MSETTNNGLKSVGFVSGLLLGIVGTLIVSSIYWSMSMWAEVERTEAAGRALGECQAEKTASVEPYDPPLPYDISGLTLEERVEMVERTVAGLEEDSEKLTQVMTNLIVGTEG